MQQKQENVCQIGLLQNNTLACVSKGLLFKHMMKMCVSVHYHANLHCVILTQNVLWNVVLTQLSEDIKVCESL